MRVIDATVVQIDEYLTTGTFAELEAGGGVQKPASQSDAKMAVNFL